MDNVYPITSDTTSAPAADGGKASPNGAFLVGLGLPLQFVAMHPDSGMIVARRVDTAEERLAAVVEMRRLNGGGRNIYAEVNIGSARNHRNSAETITHIRAVVADLDAKDGRSLDECRAAMRELPMVPTYVIETGGGLQVWYMLNTALAVSPETGDLYTKIGRALATRVSGDAVFDLPRMMRVPGFDNHPNAKKRTAGRVMQRAHVVETSGQRYTLPQLAEVFLPEERADPLVGKPPLSVDVVDNSDLCGGLPVDNWYDALSPDQKDEFLREALASEPLAGMADARHDIWLPIVAACARSGAPHAFDICRAWSATSPRYDAGSFPSRFHSFEGGRNGF